ncbi:hypothetical protein BX661DRAFT_176804 [Kickxella alabastrina]|uniref:uncharacterized protein n=1 Tax=Kickxella alabastrina TaxID=61397 RepID=UPI00221EDE79|nr:uncharacterized protein BX661DRAFT_176804 [Kickxella alabastrina]KAI7834208.1 hypothetical protein BX661DRAFT_176804 [Kickxella alabastrina]
MRSFTTYIAVSAILGMAAVAQANKANHAYSSVSVSSTGYGSSSIIASASSSVASASSSIASASSSIAPAPSSGGSAYKPSSSAGYGSSGNAYASQGDDYYASEGDIYGADGDDIYGSQGGEDYASAGNDYGAYDNNDYASEGGNDYGSDDGAYYEAQDNNDYATTNDYAPHEPMVTPQFQTVVQDIVNTVYEYTTVLVEETQIQEVTQQITNVQVQGITAQQDALYQVTQTYVCPLPPTITFNNVNTVWVTETVTPTVQVIQTRVMPQVIVQPITLTHQVQQVNVQTQVIQQEATAVVATNVNNMVQVVQQNVGQAQGQVATVVQAAQPAYAYA